MFLPPTIVIGALGRAVANAWVRRDGTRARLSVTVEHTPDAWADRTENLMVWVDGRLRGEVYGTGEVSVVYDDAARTSTYDWSFTPDPSRRNQVRVTLWPRSSPPAVSAGELLFPPVAPPVIRTATHADLTVFGEGSAQALKDAGFNTVTLNAAFNNPVWNSTIDTFDKWKVYWTELSLNKVLAAKAAGFLVLLTGDDLLRGGPEEQWMATTPWAEDAVRYAARKLGETGVCVGVDLIDEFNKPIDHELTIRVLSWWRAECDIPVAFPYIALDRVRPWEADGEYLSRLLTLTQWRDYSKDGASVWQWSEAVKVAGERTDGKRWFAMPSSCGDFTRKPATPLRTGTTPEAVIAQAWLALALGASGIRYYALDTNLWQQERLSAPPGSEVQTGARPGDARWDALSAAFNGIAARESLLAQPALPWSESFPWVYGARPGLKWAVNVSDGLEAAPFAGTLLTAAGESPVSANSPVPAGGVVINS